MKWKNSISMRTKKNVLVVEQKDLLEVNRSFSRQIRSLQQLVVLKNEVTDNPSSDTSESPTCQISVSDGIATLDGSGRWDDGSDDKISSERISENSVVKFIGSMTAIEPVIIQVALKKGSKAA